MLTRLVWQLASVFVARLEPEVALCGHNSGVKAQRIKCCVTPRQRTSVSLCACARRRVCASVCMQVCSASVCVCVLVRSSSLIAVRAIKGWKWGSVWLCVCVCFRGKQKGREGRYREGGRASQCEGERFWISCYVTFSWQEKQKPR